MRSFLLVTWLLLFAPTLLRAQTNANTNAAPPAKPAGENWMIAFLTPDQQVEYAQAHEKALADNPALKDEGDKLKQEGVAIMASGTPAQKQDFMDKMTSHRLKLRQAMLKVDPSLVPIFSEIDKHLSEAKAKGTAPAH
jgi:hypothetical protein